MDAVEHTEVRASMEVARRQLNPPREPAGRSVTPSFAAQFARHVVEGTRQHPALWLGSAAVVGFALAGVVVPRRRSVRTATRPAGSSLWGSAVRKGINVIKPALAEWGRRKVSDFLQTAQTRAQEAGAAPPPAPAPQP